MAKIREPATGIEIADVVEEGFDSLKAKVAASREAQKAWAALSLRERGHRLMPIRDALIERSDELAALIARCVGKSFIDAYATEVLPSILSVGHYCKSARKVLAPRRIPGSSVMFYNKASHLYREPWGVVGIISPWNYPFGIPFHEVMMGLVAGNGVVLKVATQAQPVGEMLASLVGAAELPDGLFALVHMAGSTAGKAFVESGIGKLFFTGSVSVGKELMRLASERLLPLSLELGGNDPMIVLPDACLPRAASGAIWAGLSNAGQSCGGVQRIYAHTSIYDELKRLLVEGIKELRMGASGGPDVEIGALATEAQRRTVEEQLADALAKGATIAVSHPAELPKGNFHPCVLLENVSGDMRIMREECFGPLMTLEPYEEIGEVIAKANDSELGLTASVWTRRRRLAQAVAECLEAGCVTLNDHLMTHGMAETPWGGYKLSGIGRTHGALGLEEMTQPKVVVRDRYPSIAKNLFWHPYSASLLKGLKGALRLLYGKPSDGSVIALVGAFLSRMRAKKRPRKRPS